MKDGALAAAQEQLRMKDEALTAAQEQLRLKDEALAAAGVAGQPGLSRCGGRTLMHDSHHAHLHARI